MEAGEGEPDLRPVQATRRVRGLVARGVHHGPQPVAGGAALLGEVLRRGPQVIYMWAMNIDALNINLLEL